MFLTDEAFLIREGGGDGRTEGSVDLAFVGQFAELPDDVVLTVEYSVRTAWTAVSRLLRLGRRPPTVHKGHHDPHVPAAAPETPHRRPAD